MIAAREWIHILWLVHELGSEGGSGIAVRRVVFCQRYVSHISKLVRATVDGVKKTVVFFSYAVKGSSFLGRYCHGSENRR